jgi:hypothetical protein
MIFYTKEISNIVEVNTLSTTNRVMSDQTIHQVDNSEVIVLMEKF